MRGDHAMPTVKNAAWVLGEGIQDFLHCWINEFAVFHLPDLNVSVILMLCLLTPFPEEVGTQQDLEPEQVLVFSSSHLWNWRVSPRFCISMRRPLGVVCLKGKHCDPFSFLFLVVCHVCLQIWLKRVIYFSVSVHLEPPHKGCQPRLSSQIPSC